MSHQAVYSYCKHSIVVCFYSNDVRTEMESKRKIQVISLGTFLWFCLLRKVSLSKINECLLLLNEIVTYCVVLHNHKGIIPYGNII